MANAHRTNVLVTSCLKTPVDPNTKAPLASYEREMLLPSGYVDNRDYEKEKYEDSGSDLCDEEDCLGNGDPHIMATYRATEDRFNLSEIFFSNEEYYSKLEELKKAHLRTMAELESMYQQKLQLRTMEPLDRNCFDFGNNNMSPVHGNLPVSVTECPSCGNSHRSAPPRTSSTGATSPVHFPSSNPLGSP